MYTTKDHMYAIKEYFEKKMCYLEKDLHQTENAETKEELRYEIMACIHMIRWAKKQIYGKAYAKKFVLE